MASVRETNNIILRKLECLERRTEDIHKLLKCQAERMNHIQPQSRLPAIPRPSQGVSIGRTASITAYLRHEIRRLNSEKSDKEPRYIEVPSDADDKQLNKDALNCLEIILMFHLDFNYGRMSWEKVTKKMPRVAATIYREARMTPELAVFCQTAALWAIDLLLAAKMKSRMRSISDEDQGEECPPVVQITKENEPAVSVVPEITEVQPSLICDSNDDGQLRQDVGAEQPTNVFPVALRSNVPANCDSRVVGKRSRQGGKKNAGQNLASKKRNTRKRTHKNLP